MNCEGCKHYEPETAEPYLGKCDKLREELGMDDPVIVEDGFLCRNWECKNGLWEMKVEFV